MHAPDKSTPMGGGPPVRLNIRGRLLSWLGSEEDTPSLGYRVLYGWFHENDNER